MDLQRIAARVAGTEQNDWLEEELQRLDLAGRDELYTHLITQEIPMWISSIREGAAIGSDEVDWLAQRRGFNEDEQRKFRGLASFLNDRAERIRARQ